MTKEEFDSSTFCKDDEIIVRRYFRMEREDIESVDFEQRTINGYKHSQIIEHIKHHDNERHNPNQRVDRCDHEEAVEGPFSEHPF